MMNTKASRPKRDAFFVSFLLAREMLDPVGHDDSVRVFTKLAIIEFLAVNADGKTAVFAQFLVAFTC